MYYPKLIGTKCYLSVVNPEDYKRYTTWVNDLEVIVGLGLAHRVMTESVEKEILEKLSKSEYNFSIIDKKTEVVR